MEKEKNPLRIKCGPCNVSFSFGDNHICRPEPDLEPVPPPVVDPMWEHAQFPVWPPPPDQLPAPEEEDPPTNVEPPAPPAEVAPPPADVAPPPPPPPNAD